MLPAQVSDAATGPCVREAPRKHRVILMQPDSPRMVAYQNMSGTHTRNMYGRVVEPSRAHCAYAPPGIHAELHALTMGQFVTRKYNATFVKKVHMYDGFILDISDKLNPCAYGGRRGGSIAFHKITKSRRCLVLPGRAHLFYFAVNSGHCGTSEHKIQSSY